MIEALTRLLVGEKRQSPAPWDDYWYQPRGIMTGSGVRVEPDTARQLSAVWLCDLIIRETVGSLPLDIFRRVDERNKERASDHWLFELIKNQPNGNQTAMEFREVMQRDLTMRGRAFAEIVRRPRSAIVEELIWLDARTVQKVALGGNRFGYLVQERGGRRELRRDQMFEITANGGKGVIECARESFGYSLATESFGSNMFRNRAVPGGVLKTPEVLDDKSYKRLQSDWDSSYGGPTNAGKVAILEQGLEWQSIGMTNQDAEFMANRRWSVKEIARWFNMPLSFLKDLDQGIRANVEQQFKEFEAVTMRPWFVRWQQAIHRDLIPDSEKDALFAEFNVRPLWGADFKTIIEGFGSAVEKGIFNRDEARGVLNMNEIEGGGGKIHTVQLNMMDLNDVGENSPDSEPQVEEGDRAIRSEARARRSAEERRRIQNAHIGVMADAGRRIVNREAREVRKIIAKELKKRTQPDLDSALKDFYGDGFRRVVSASARPAFGALAAVIYAVALREAGGSGSIDEAWVRSYAERIGVAYSLASLRQLRALIRRQVSDDELEGLLEKRISQWVDRRPDKFAFRTVKTGAAAAALEAYRRSGVREKRWLTFGENCPSCERLNGRIVGIEDAFVPAGSITNPTDEEQEPIRIRRDVLHPQLHGGCDCQISI